MNHIMFLSDGKAERVRRRQDTVPLPTSLPPMTEVKVIAQCQDQEQGVRAYYAFQGLNFETKSGSVNS